MTREQSLTNPGGNDSANPAFLAAVRDASIETPEPIAKAEQLLERRRFELVMRMTAQRFAKLSPTEKRNYRSWAEHFESVFSEKANLFRRNTPADVDTPTYLQRA